MSQETKGYKISELARLSSVSKQTIHFYLREGLLLPPTRTSKNMAYYDESTVEDIRFIKELQEKRYLPLTVIKEVLKAKREGHDLIEEDHLTFFDHLFGQVQGGVAGRQLDEASFLAETDLTKQELDQLIRMGMISPSPEVGNRPFDGSDLALAAALKGLLAMGMRLQDLNLYGSFLQLARTEIGLVHDRIIHLDAEEQHLPLNVIYSGLEKVRNILIAKAYREYFMNHMHAEHIEKDK